MTSSDRRAAERRGRTGEAFAALWLQLKGYVVLDRRARTPLGEIDIVARRGRTLVFIEVKERRRLRDALEAIPPAARERLMRAAEAWAARRGGVDHLNVRFDAVIITPWRAPTHVKDAWRPGDGEFDR